MEIIQTTQLNLPDRIDFNYQQLKDEIGKKLETYKGKESTDATNYKDRKNDRARLNDFARSLSDEKKRVKAQLLAPMTNGSSENLSYSDQIDDLVNTIKATVAEIDAGIKAYEERMKEQKRSDIMTYLHSHVTDAFINDESAQVYEKSGHFDRFAEAQMNRSRNAWLNATCSDEFIRGEIDAEVERCVQAVKLIEATTKDDDDLTKEKAKNALALDFDVNHAIFVVNAHKAEVAAVKAREEQRRIYEEHRMAEKVVVSDPIQVNGVKPTIYSCTLKFVGTVEAFQNLKDYLSMNKGIKYTTVEQMAEVK